MTDIDGVSVLMSTGRDLPGRAFLPPGQHVLPYPERLNGWGTGIHLHVEVNAGARNVDLQLVNPLALTPGTASQYLWNLNTESDQPSVWVPMPPW